MKPAMRILIVPALAAGLAIGCASGGGGSAPVTGGSAPKQEPKKSEASKSEPVAQLQKKQVKKPAQQAKKKPARPAKQPRPARQKPKSSEKPSPKGDERFADDAFPPTVSDVGYHKKAWFRNDCLRCHETGVGKAPMVVHESMLSSAQQAILKTAKCRSCHVKVPGSKPSTKKRKRDERFDEFAFPPMIPASASHRGAWGRQDCLLCHEDGIKGAPIAEHKSMLTSAQRKILSTAKCRSCHVQVRTADNQRRKRNR